MLIQTNTVGLTQAFTRDTLCETLIFAFVTVHSPFSMKLPEISQFTGLRHIVQK